MPTIHPIDPVWDENARILILGSFPSVRSREAGFYYAHPQNRFWLVLSSVLGETNPPADTQARRAFALSHGIALWDVIHSCEITASSDASIRDVIPNDVALLLKQTSIRQIYCNGRRAYDLYCRYLAEETGMEAILLPSTSPANAAWGLDRLVQAWKIIRTD